MSYVFNQAEQDLIANARAQCPDSNDAATDSNNWVPFYQTLSNVIGARVQAGNVAGADLQDLKNAKLWLDVAIGTNGGTGIHSTFIRTYTSFQGELRLGQTIAQSAMQLASNGVALSLWRDLSGLSPNVPSWTVPKIATIAQGDATSIGTTLFAQLGTIDSAFAANGGWAGTLGFNDLGGSAPYESWRLVLSGDSSPTTATPNTLDDFKNLLFAVASYQKAFQAAFLTGVEPLANMLIVGSGAIPYLPITSLPAFIAQYHIGSASGDWLGLINDVAAHTPTIAQEIKTITDIGPNRFLDMLRSAVQGKPVTDATTDATLVSKAHDFFSTYTAAQLQGLSAELLPNDAAQLITLAATDVNVRAALGALSLVSVAVPNLVAQKYTGGDITTQWIADRAAMLEAVAHRDPDKANYIHDQPTVKFVDSDAGTILSGSSQGNSNFFSEKWRKAA